MSDSTKRPSSHPAANVRLPMNRESYTCPELKRNPGIDDSRFDAYRLPSRMGDRLVYPKRMP